MRLILASKSPARLKTLRHAGLNPEVMPPDVDESGVHGLPPGEHTATLARLKGEAGLVQLGATSEPTALIACDSMLELEGRVFGKPGTPAAAVARWYRMRAREGVLYTGHFVALVDGDIVRRDVRVASTIVTFADLTDAEIAAYAATGEPQKVAGAFTIDGFGGPFITRVQGDPHNVVGISLPLVRQMLLDMGVEWHAFWPSVFPAAKDSD